MPTKKIPPLAVSVVLAAATVFLYFEFRSRTAEPWVPVLRTAQDYNTTADKVEKLVTAPLQRFDAGQGLSIKDQDDLHNALGKVRGLNLYDPEYTTYFLAGKIEYVLGHDQEALQEFNEAVQCVQPPDSSRDFYVKTLAEARYLSSLCFFNQSKFNQAADQARQAAELVPKSALYKVAEAQAYAQMGKDGTALGLLKDALKIDPKNDKALQLWAFIQRHPGAK